MLILAYNFGVGTPQLLISSIGPS